MKKITITQIKSLIGQNKRQIATMKTLGLGKINQSVSHTETASIAGMVKKIKHLVIIT